MDYNKNQYAISCLWQALKLRNNHYLVCRIYGKNAAECNVNDILVFKEFASFAT